MFVKKFEAPSLEQALAMVKTEMGPSALIISTQHIKGKWFQKSLVEITAALEKKAHQSPGYDDNTLMELFPHRRNDSPKYRRYQDQ